DSGEFTVLVGPSGCGKSTLLNIVAGLDQASAGVVEIGGKPMNGVAAKDRNIAMVFQSYALYPSMTVRQNMTFGMECRRVPKRPQAIAIIGWARAARGKGTCSGARSIPVPVRRAAVQLGCQAADRDADGDQAAASAARLNDRLCHARPGRGDDTGDPPR